MRRTALTVVILAALAAWASAQAPAPGAAAGERMDQFARNRALLESLVARGVELADADDPLKRAKVCHAAAGEIGGRVREAVAAGDPVRVAELAEYLGAVARDGLIPTLRDARAAIPVKSPEEEALVALRDEAGGGVGQAAAAIPEDGRIGTSAGVRGARQQLADARGQMSQIK
jgi:hypothetical protein